jgi:hypothetical protein
MRHEEPILHLRIVLSQTTSAGIGMRGYIIAVSLSASMTRPHGFGNLPPCEPRAAPPANAD